MKFPIALTILAALAVVHSAPIPTSDSTGVHVLHHTGSVAASHDLAQSLEKRHKDADDQGADDQDADDDLDLKKRSKDADDQDADDQGADDEDADDDLDL
ncbi:hypothetical protein CPC16_008166 [Podila verticillata]|nr:hypothetical protein CPC16_008166 [Podila verticillata]